MISYQKNFIRIVECWSNERSDICGFDLERYFQQPQPREGMICRPFYTIRLDLNRGPEKLFANMKRGTRYEIRRAASRDGLSYHCSDGSDPKVFHEFCNSYDDFAAQKGRPKLDRTWLALLAETRALNLTRVADDDGKTLVWHGYLRTPQGATLLYSASPFRSKRSSADRNKIGRANRYLHWEDFLRFKADGIATYDFGGWYEGNKDLELLKINKFKEQFGGAVVKTYICEGAVTMRGKVFLHLRGWLLGNAI